MSGLRDFLASKRQAWLSRQDHFAAAGVSPSVITARATVEGASGVRRIRIREHQLLSDSPSGFAGFDLGPSSAEVLLGALSSCVAHVFLIQAAAQEIPLDAVTVDISAEVDPRAGNPGLPVTPQNIAYTATVVSPAAPETITTLYESVEAACPILNLLTNPQTITSTLRHQTPEAAALA